MDTLETLTAELEDAKEVLKGVKERLKKNKLMISYLRECTQDKKAMKEIVDLNRSKQELLKSAVLFWSNTVDQLKLKLKSL